MSTFLARKRNRMPGGSDMVTGQGAMLGAPTIPYGMVPVRVLNGVWNKPGSGHAVFIDEIWVVDGSYRTGTPAATVPNLTVRKGGISGTIGGLSASISSIDGGVLPAGIAAYTGLCHGTLTTVETIRSTFPPGFLHTTALTVIPNRLDLGRSRASDIVLHPGEYLEILWSQAVAATAAGMVPSLSASMNFEVSGVGTFCTTAQNSASGEPLLRLVNTSASPIGVRGITINEVGDALYLSTRTIGVYAGFGLLPVQGSTSETRGDSVIPLDSSHPLPVGIEPMLGSHSYMVGFTGTNAHNAHTPIRYKPFLPQMKLPSTAAGVDSVPGGQILFGGPVTSQLSRIRVDEGQSFGVFTKESVGAFPNFSVEMLFHVEPVAVAGGERAWGYSA